MTRTVRDSAALLDVLRGPGAGDPFVIAPPLRRYAEEVGAPTGKLRVAVSHNGTFNATVDEEIRQEVMWIARHLEGLGHVVAEASPTVDEAAYHSANMTYVFSFLAEGILDGAQMSGRQPSIDTLEATTLAGYEYGLTLKALDLEMADMNSNNISRSVASFFHDYDVLLTPTTIGAALPLGFCDSNDRSTTQRAGMSTSSATHHSPLSITSLVSQPSACHLGWIKAVCLWGCSLWGASERRTPCCAWPRNSKNPSLGRDGVPLSMSRGR